MSKIFINQPAGKQGDNIFRLVTVIMICHHHSGINKTVLWPLLNFWCL